MQDSLPRRGGWPGTGFCKQGTTAMSRERSRKREKERQRCRETRVAGARAQSARRSALPLRVQQEARVDAHLLASPTPNSPVFGAPRLRKDRGDCARRRAFPHCFAFPRVFLTPPSQQFRDRSGGRRRVAPRGFASLVGRGERTSTCVFCCLRRRASTRISLLSRLPILLFFLFAACAGTGETARVDAHLPIPLPLHCFFHSYPPSPSGT